MRVINRLRFQTIIVTSLNHLELTVISLNRPNDQPIDEA